MIARVLRGGPPSLYYYLCRPPDSAGPTAAKEDAFWEKEVHFFDDKFWRGVDWYRSFFPLSVSRALARRRNRDVIALEATPGPRNALLRGRARGRSGTA